MDVLVLASQKGGAGKTTLSGHLAVAAEQAGHGPVLVIDTDPQGSLTSWWNRREPESPALAPVLALRDLPKILNQLGQTPGYQTCIIDTPPAITASIREVMRNADLVLMPVRPSPHDLDAIGATIDIATQVRVPHIFVVTQAKMQARVTPQAVALLSAYGTVVPAIIQDRVIYATAMTDGRAVNEVDPRGAAAREIADLWRFVRGRLDDNRKGEKNGRKKVA